MQLKWEHSLMVSNLHSETKGSWFDLDCLVCSEVSSLWSLYFKRLIIIEAGGIGREEVKKYPLPSLLSCES